jgi:hypothetical protein
MTTDQELAYQARIRELVEACKEEHIGVLDGNNGECPICVALSRPDDLSALEAYVREEKRKVLIASAELLDTAHPEAAAFFHKVAEELK